MTNDIITSILKMYNKTMMQHRVYPNQIEFQYVGNGFDLTFYKNIEDDDWKKFDDHNKWNDNIYYYPYNNLDDSKYFMNENDIKNSIIHETMNKIEDFLRSKDIFTQKEYNDDFCTLHCMVSGNRGYKISVDDFVNSTLNVEQNSEYVGTLKLEFVVALKEDSNSILYLHCVEGRPFFFESVECLVDSFNRFLHDDLKLESPNFQNFDVHQIGDHIEEYRLISFKMSDEDVAKMKLYLG